MGKCKYCKAKMGTMLQPNLDRARPGVCRNCWERRYQAKLDKKAQGSWFDRTGAKLDAKTAELNERAAAARQAQSTVSEPGGSEQARFVDCPSGHTNYDAGPSCRTCGASMAGAQPRAQAAAMEPQYVPCPSGHLNHPSRSECLVCGSALGGTAAPEEKMCPMCAELVKARARICRFCQHAFPEVDAS